MAPRRRHKPAPAAPRLALRPEPSARVLRAPARGHSVDVVRDHGVYGAFGYHSARVTAKDGRSPTAGSGDEHAQNDRERLQWQAREFMRDNGIYKRMIDGATSYIVGTGFGLQAKTADPAWNEAAEAVFREWGERAEIRGIQSWLEVEQEICREILGVGDVGVLLTKAGQIQVVEAEQIKGSAPNVDGLVRDSASGRITGFMVSPYGKAGAPQVVKARKIDPKDFLFLTRPERPSMARSVPPLQSSFPMLHRIKDVCDSEAIAWQMLARVAIVINRQNAGLIAHETSEDDETKSGEETGNDFSSRVHDLDQATIFHGEPGEELKGVDRNLPGKDFPQSIVTFIRLTGIALGMPIEVILLDWSKSNYSQSRAVLEQFHTSFQTWQMLIERFFHRPVYRWVIQRAMADGLLEKRQDWSRHEWIKPTFPWIDQRQEAEAQGMKIDRSFCTHAHVLKSQGYDRGEILAARQLEVEGAIKIAKDIEAKYPGVVVPWEPFAGMVPPKPVAPPAEADAGAEKPDDESAKVEVVVKKLLRDASGRATSVEERRYKEPRK